MVSGKEETTTLGRKLNMGMVGGGRDAFIGAVHRRAAMLDGNVELVAGCFSSNAKTSKLSGQDFFLKVTYGFLSRLFDLPSKFLVLFEEKNSCFSLSCVILINVRGKEHDRC